MKKSCFIEKVTFAAVTAVVMVLTIQCAGNTETPLSDEQEKTKEWAFPVPESEIEHYTALHTGEVIVVDGHLDEASWLEAPRSPRFVDCITGAPAMYDTRAAVLWDDENLYVAYWIEEPNLQATLTERDSKIYTDNDVELFIAGKDAYYEFEINAFGTIYEVFFIWQEAYDRGDYGLDPALSRSILVPFHGVDFKPHPRGPRLRSNHWDFPGAKTAVHLQGTINEDSDTDTGWTVELSFPWKGMRWLAEADGRTLPPEDGDTWRMDFSRFNQYKAPPPAEDSGGWFLSRHGVWDSHIPELFPFVHFSKEDVMKAGKDEP